jgi:predicted phage baseplate assembly protein
MSFELGEIPVVDGTIEVFVQDGDIFSKWTQVQHLLDYGPTNLVYSVFSDSDNIVNINFGDGVSGAIPTNYSEIRVRYTVGGGSVGNISASTLDSIDYLPGLSEGETTAIQGAITLTNETVGLGGSDPESNEQIRIAAPSSLRSGNRAVTLKDFADLAVSVSGVGKANATADVWTSVTLYLAPTRTAQDTDIAPGLDDNEDPTAEFDRLEEDVSEYLADKTLIGTTVTIQPPTYVDAVVTMEYTKLETYTTEEAEENIKNALLTGFGYINMAFEDTIYPRDIEFVVQQAPGIETITVTALFEFGAGSSLTTLIGEPDEIFRFLEENVNLSEI